MNWETVCVGLNAIECGGPSVEVNGVAYDSRRVGRGDVFVAMRGEATDGNRYIEAAVAQGASAVGTGSRGAYAEVGRGGGGGVGGGSGGGGGGVGGGGGGVSG